MTSFMTIDAQIPEDLYAAQGVDTRYTFRRTVENRLRPRFNALRDEIKGATIYPAIAKYWQVQQKTGDTVEFNLYNFHPAARYLEEVGGTPPHTIVQAAHVIPLSRLEPWAIKLGIQWMGVKTLQWWIANRGRDLVIEHPGTKEDTPVINAIDRAQGEMEAAVDDAISVWMDRFGAVEVQ